MSERTLVVLKPDVAERNLIGAIIRMFEEANLKIVAINMRTVDSSLVAQHYPDTMAEALGKKSERAGDKIDDYIAQGMRVLEWNRKYLTRGPVVAIILESSDVIRRVRKLTGYTDPTEADIGTIRGEYGKDSIAMANREGRAVENLIHASGSVEEAQSEIKLWFNIQ